MPRVTQWVLCGVLGWGLSACGDAGRDAASGPGKPASAASASPSAAAPPDPASATRVELAPGAPPTMTLLSPGAAPRAPLQWSPQVGVQDAIRMTLNTNLWSAGERMQAPPIIVEARVRVDAVTDTQVDLTYTVHGMNVGDDEGAEPAMLTTVGSLLGDAGPIVAHVQRRPNGSLKAGFVDVPPSVTGPARQVVEGVAQAVAQLQVPLPQEDVGVGATWTSVGTAVQGGMELEQTATYRLTKRDGETLELSAKIGQKLISPSFSPPGMPALKAKVTMFQSGGEATVALSTVHPAPTTMELAIKLKMAMEVSVLGQTQSQDVQIDTGLKLARQDAP